MEFHRQEEQLDWVELEQKGHVAHFVPAHIPAVTTADSVQPNFAPRRVILETRISTFIAGNKKEDAV